MTLVIQYSTVFHHQSSSQLTLNVGAFLSTTFVVCPATATGPLQEPTQIFIEEYCTRLTDRVSTLFYRVKIGGSLLRLNGMKRFRHSPSNEYGVSRPRNNIRDKDSSSFVRHQAHVSQTTPRHGRNGFSGIHTIDSPNAGAGGTASP